jgi:hypothetical protein
MPSSGMLRRMALVRSDVVFLLSVRRLFVSLKVALRCPILVTLMMEALHFSDTSVLTRTTRHDIPEDGIIPSNRR